MTETAARATGRIGEAPLSIRVRDVHVEYELVAERRAALRARFAKRANTARRSIHAVKGVSFDIHEGEAVGMIGSNGSGKSTLLAAIAGLLAPVSGEILVNDEPKLMGVGATLIPASTGARNIRLGCLALGMHPDEVEERFDEIAEFTELGEALERPLRTYSSGMRARLHFAIATSVRPRILLIDEALAVGDKRFRRKSSARIAELLAGAGTLILVSHGLPEIRKHCSRVIWLEQGVIQMDGPVDEVFEAYQDDDV